MLYCRRKPGGTGASSAPAPPPSRPAGSVSERGNGTSGGRFDCCGEDVQAALELFVGRGKRRQQPDHVAVEAAGEKQQTLLPSLRRDGLRHVAGPLDELDRA